MWTPKRIVMLAGWFALFIGAYAGFNFFLGGIDGLPPLPERYKPMVDDPNYVFPQPPEFSADRKLRMAFGEQCVEVKDRKFKLEIEPRGIVLAAQDVTVEKDGRAKLKPFSVAYFGKDKGDHKYPDITTIQADDAYLTFDRPITNITEMGNRKIMAAELVGTVKIKNNRQSNDNTDDVSLETQGPLFYDEPSRHIYTSAPVKLLDLKSKPNPTTVEGEGMDLYLAADTAKPATPGQPAAKNKQESVSGVDKVALRKDVTMHLWVDAKSGMLGSTKSEPAPGKPAVAAPPVKAAGPLPPAEEEERSQVVINTQGPFTYNFKTDYAVFESSKTVPFPNPVAVDRLNKSEDKNTLLTDHLECELLEIQFNRKTPSGTPAAGQAEGLDIETIRATGKNVVLKSDAEVLEAYGNEFTYNKAAGLSRLKGVPDMIAIKDGNRMRAPELELVDPKKDPKNPTAPVKGQQATAIGQGSIEFWTEGAKKAQEAHWTKKLVYIKEADKDLLTLTGKAVFRDPEHEQELHGEELRVTLAPADKPPADKAGADKKPEKDAKQPSPKPTQVEAIERVMAKSPDMYVHDSDHLLMFFHEAPPNSLPPPAAQAAAKPGEAGAAAKPADGSNNFLGTNTGANDPNKKPRPVDVSANFVQVHVLRRVKPGSQRTEYDLQDVWCKGNVKVHQEPEKPEDKPVDIEGDTLSMTHHAEGNVLTVCGNNAHVQTDQLYILGPEINIDQIANDTEVKGMGVMRMPCRQSIDGTDLAKPTELTVNWDKRMFFDGQQATFTGSVFAVQDSGQMRCQELQVTFEKRISLKEGQKEKGKPAAVDKLVCHEQVVLEDWTKDATGKIIAFKRINCPSLSIDNDNENKESKINAAGPGLVRLFGKRAKGDGLGGPPAGQNAARAPGATPAAPGETELKVTLVYFDRRMTANKKMGLAIFYDGVEVIDVPSVNPELEIKKGARLPPGFMYLKCDRMEVAEHKLPFGATSRDLRAKSRVYAEGQNYAARCEELDYDESMEKIIFKGTSAAPAELYKEKVQGAGQDKFSAQTIFYNRLTGEHSADNVRGTTIGQ